MNTFPGYPHADPTALAWFTESLEHLDTIDGLVAAVEAIGRHFIKTTARGSCQATLDAWAETVLGRLRHPSPHGLLAHLHEVLFAEAGFQGNHSQYLDPRNSQLPWVLESRRGLPILLVLIYKAVGTRLALNIDGLNCPGHFLARVALPGETALIDPYYGGELLTAAEARERIEQIVGAALPADMELFRPAAHGEWLARILRNLHNSLSESEQIAELAAMQQFAELLAARGLAG